MMNYKGYVGVAEVDAEDRMLYGKVIGLKDVIGFEGSDFEELEGSFHRAVDGYLEFCAEDGVEPEKPYSGKILIRTDPELHRQVVVAAAAADMLMNQWLEKTLKERKILPEYGFSGSLPSSSQTSRYPSTARWNDASSSSKFEPSKPITSRNPITLP